MSAITVLSIAGAALVLASYLLLQFGYFRPSDIAYIALNLAGSVLLSVVACVGHQWVFLLVNVCWAIGGAIALMFAVFGAT